jgi:drug/metabolite transporter (DMT)-like permease
MLHKGIIAALVSALLFGAGTPLAKLLLNHVSPWLLAGLMYIGSGIVLSLYRFIISAPSELCLEKIWCG